MVSMGSAYRVGEGRGRGRAGGGARAAARAPLSRPAASSPPQGADVGQNVRFTYGVTVNPRYAETLSAWALSACTATTRHFSPPG